MIARFRHLLGSLRDQCGSMAIETALVAPVLVVIALGTFEASLMVARQTELQQAAAEVGAIVRAAPPDTNSERNTIRDIVATSTGLGTNQVAIAEVYRCGTSESYALDSAACAGGQTSTFIQVTITDTYDPLWTQFGIGGVINYTVKRTVQIG